MHQMIIQDFDIETWTNIIEKFVDLSLVQTWAYGEAKMHHGPWQVERGLFLKKGHPIGAFQAIIRRLPFYLRGGLVWINRGPISQGIDDPDGNKHLPSMLNTLRYHYVVNKGYYLRIAPPITGKFFPPLGYRRTINDGWSSEKLDLTANKETLRANLKQKWRNSLNKATKSGIKINIGTDSARINLFLDTHRIFLNTKTFMTTITPEFLSIWHRLEQITREPIALLAYKDDQIIASALIARYGNTAEYLAGNVSNIGRKINAGALLLWRAVLEAKARGLTWFDLGGVDPLLTPSGIFKFKNGLGGIPYRLTNEIDTIGKRPLNQFFGKLLRQRIDRMHLAKKRTML